MAQSSFRLVVAVVVGSTVVLIFSSSRASLQVGRIRLFVSQDQFALKTSSWFPLSPVGLSRGVKKQVGFTRRSHMISKMYILCEIINRENHETAFQGPSYPSHPHTPPRCAATKLTLHSCRSKSNEWNTWSQSVWVSFKFCTTVSRTVWRVLLTRVPFINITLFISISIVHSLHFQSLQQLHSYQGLRQSYI